MPRYSSWHLLTGGAGLEPQFNWVRLIKPRWRNIPAALASLRAIFFGTGFFAYLVIAHASDVPIASMPQAEASPSPA